jgi:hypothetical protein
MGARLLDILVQPLCKAGLGYRKAAWELVCKPRMGRGERSEPQRRRFSLSPRAHPSSPACISQDYRVCFLLGFALLTPTYAGLKLQEGDVFCGVVVDASFGNLP